jgi:predicted DNA-binding mobile mystery protein A
MVTNTSLARTALDGRLTHIRLQGAAFVRPRAGWIRALREALGMTAGQLARRMGVAQPTLTKLEQSEAAERIQLDSLRRVAAALDCELVYALVPRRPLQDMVDARRRLVAGREYARTAHSMALEDQFDADPTTQAVHQAAVSAGVRERDLWDET